MFVTSFIIGSFFPDIDIILVAISSFLTPLNQSIFLFHKTLTHSFISLAGIYLIFLIAYEIKKNKLILYIGNGFSWGIITHIILDLIFRFGKIDILWPLPIGLINGLHYENYRNIVLGLDLLFFRLLASELIKIILNANIENNNINFIKPLTLWMKYHSYLLMLFILTVYFKPEYTLIIFGILYIPSYIMSLLSIYKIRNYIEAK
tara:strand:+ start:20917 stop:21531 length:615 start_codon:yes stop_codon:yes gene_type:complete